MSGIHDFYEPAETVLLTGAGFTKTFGGFLGGEMWAVILNQLELDDQLELRTPMFKKLDYEALYDEVEDPNKNYSDNQKAALRDAIRRAYNEMDDNLSSLGGRNSDSAHTACMYFIQRFAGPVSEKTRGFFFTLNQDLFVERFFSNGNDPGRSTLRAPGADHPKWFKGEHHQRLEANDTIKLPDDPWTSKKSSKTTSRQWF